ncbi:hypothetical protein Q7P37_000146 [Cladosporium fusiforme]
MGQSSMQSAQVSTTTLLNALHNAYSSGQPYALESSTSLVVNTWVSATQTGADGRVGGTVDVDLARRAWEHARRRAEDSAIVLGSLHRSTPTLLAPFVSALPLSVPGAFYTALNALRPFLHTATPYNPSLPRYSALSTSFALNLTGEITGASISLSSSGIDTNGGLLNVPAEQGHRAFDVFYYLLTSASSAEREFLGLRAPQKYTLLRRSDTYDPPQYLPTADDAAAADDFRDSLKAIGIKGESLRNLLSIVAALLRLGDGIGFLVDEEELEATCEEVAGLLDIDPEVLLKKCATEEREALLAAIYEALVDWVISKANEAIKFEMQSGRTIGSSSGSDVDVPTPPSSHDEGDSVSITVIEVPSQELGKALSLKTVFDDSTGINAEMRDDGVQSIPAGSSVIREMNQSVANNSADLDIVDTPAARARENDLDRREGALEKVGAETESDSFLRRILYPIDGSGILLGKHGRFSLTNVLASSRAWFHLCLHPSDDLPASLANRSSQNLSWSAGSVSGQIRTWRLPEWANHRNKQLDFTADFDIDEFVDRYSRLGCQPGRDGVESWIMERGWSNGEVVIGSERVWIRESAWWEAECMLDMKVEDTVGGGMMGGMMGAGPMESSYSVATPAALNGIENPFYSGSQYGESRDNLASRAPSLAAPSRLGAASMAPTAMRNASGGDYGLGFKGDDKKQDVTYYGEVDGELVDGKTIIEEPVPFTRRAWVAFAWALTFWIPSFVLKYVGRMKRPDVRLAWREKVALVFLIALMNGIVIFYIVFFGKLLCPNSDKAWNQKQVSTHQGDNDWYVSWQGGVYDLTTFWKIQHSDMAIETTEEMMSPFAGANVDNIFPVPLAQACPGLGIGDDIRLRSNSTPENPLAIHSTGPNAQPDPDTVLNEADWYSTKLIPRMKEYYKGPLVVKKGVVKSEGQDQGHKWFILDGTIYDLTDYYHTIKEMDNYPGYEFLSSEVTRIINEAPGLDISKKFNDISNTTMRENTRNCLKNAFQAGIPDFRDSAKCQVNNYILLAFTIMLCTIIVVKFLAALQLGSKPRPAAQDKFVICQVPAYTEGEDSLRKGLDSLTALAYDNKRKLICVICDGMIVGGGNDRPTPKIVLDVLGVDPKIDPPALPFKSVGNGSEQLNYGKVYSGLYEYEGNVVPYLVVVKVGKESEQNKSKPGNRGKRDSQVLLMNFLNRVHHRSPMSPLELEMFHQINNIIGVDPELYEYLFMVDADTKVKEDSLNRLVAACAHDAKIAGICGETSLENEDSSWWTMMQVYEYYISHNLAKAFESLFASVTCLPGCFCMYRLRTADKGRPLIISDKIINDYAINDLDTLHKKNLLSLGEDRYLTTLMIKHFPTTSYKFVADAYALTEAPSEWSVLLSQRRRWINSTIHNLAELVWIKDLCGFCCFSMRFVVFIDLMGTIILPATCAYLAYLIYRVASNEGSFPLISIIMIAGVYGLQAVIFIVKRQWQHIGWMIVYMIAYPIYSFILPVYSFWKQDDFSWGNTRVVIGEKGNKQIVAVDDEGFDPRSIPLQRWDDYALANNLPGRRGMPMEKQEGMYSDQPYGAAGYEMDDIHSVYSSAKPASTILTGFPQQQFYRPPTQSPGPYNALNRQSTYSRFTDNPGAEQHQRLMSSSNLSDHYRLQSQDNLGAMGPSPPMQQQQFGAFPPQQRATSPYGAGVSHSRPASTNNLAGFQTQGPSNDTIARAIRECLNEVDLDTVTKKQLKALAEQKLQCQLVGDRRAFLDSQIDFELANM